ncbi:putative uncharacterized protein DDB_G0286901 isoform X2 [Argiope bruennichi]|uniref:putative uncharacterized protein DDB_G0286901 isoform X2 n=1 Tax=Argiope bruennichi TaxID=94029 RepID=UPI0024948743|nr:putative uncharacterized protein DDB_G0286901 isoform X2 [Argiope bruennichi]XP_055941586.1 putative uncharacterized protein DDB_G0286901 isoform X2 [Argiope bruennichi]XP_055941587.1 putative uncharacterized protein DDB_G0286901 isoform X2 [Argiope bruennichi]XP_055941588.1 putative uncharacterized protein DDB_G0286901 isoform X2 [Argiope bruennichi]
MQVPGKLKKKKLPQSKVLQTIVCCLKNRKYPHVLYWFNEIRQEFIIRFVHKNNSEWKVDDLELFIELDKLSKKYEEYKQDKDYDTKCKGRCRANLLKLVNKGYITFIEDIPNGSTTLKKYKINVKVIPSIKNSNDSKRSKGSNDNALCRYKSIDGIADNEVKFKTETQPNEQSHCLCLPKFQPIIVYVNLLLGDAPISNFGMMSTNSDTDGKSVNQNGNIESMNVSGTNPCYATSEYSGLQNNTNVLNGYQFGISTNSTGSPMIEMSNSNSDTDAKLVNPNGNIESMNVNGADTCYAISEYNGLQNNMNVHDGLQNNMNVHDGLQNNMNVHDGLQNNMNVHDGLQNNMNVHDGLQNNMNVHDGLQNNMNVHDGLQNNMNVHDGYEFGISTNSTESPMFDMSNNNSDTDGKTVNQNGNIESMNVNRADACYPISEYNGLQNNINMYSEYQIGIISTNSTESPMIDTRNNSDVDGKAINRKGNENIESMNVNGADACYSISKYNGLQNMNVYNGLQSNVKVHNGYQLGISTNSTASLLIDKRNNSDTDGKLVNPNEDLESMDVNEADTCYSISEYSGLQNNINVHNAYQNEGCNINDIAVPSSPMNAMDILNNLSSDWYSDFDKDIVNPFQQDSLFSCNVNFSSNHLFEESGCLLSDEARSFVI